MLNASAEVAADLFAKISRAEKRLEDMRAKLIRLVGHLDRESFSEYARITEEYNQSHG